RLRRSTASNLYSTTSRKSSVREERATVEWDSAITLAFAAEHLFEAAQLLTSDLVPWETALKIANEQHMLPLLENDSFLPEAIRARLLAAQDSYLNSQSHGMSREFARQLARELMDILNQISTRLIPIAGPAFLRIDPQAA